MKESENIMKFQKKIEDIKFNADRYTPTLQISEPIVMASAAGWYIGAICKDKTECGGMIQPYDRYSGYMPKEMALQQLREYV
tara:strand:+ start:774 stop:1019 length:246 start_codon:yes stop_codon:yes gene_type:complete